MLYFVPTPIGNLSEISSRALEILQNCEILICEDTRVTKQLLNLLSQKFNIEFKKKNFYPLHTHNTQNFFSTFDANDFANKICVYVSDAGMPCISDPGVELVRYAIENDVAYEFLSGSNAAILAVGASGLVDKEFTFLGFLANKGLQRSNEISNAMRNPYPCVIYESPKRILNLIQTIADLDSGRKIFAIKEATKKFEMKFNGCASEILEILKQSNLNGEWCVVIAPKKQDCISRGNIDEKDILELSIPPKAKAKLLAKLTGENPKKIYENLIK